MMYVCQMMLVMLVLMTPLTASASSHQSRPVGGRSRLASSRAIRGGAEKKPAERRTFITALLAAEVAYLEGILSDRTQPRPRPSRRPTKPLQVHRSPAHPIAQAHSQVPPVKKLVAKLDPFYMLDAPDLSGQVKHHVKPSLKVKRQPYQESAPRNYDDQSPSKKQKSAPSPTPPSPVYGALSTTATNPPVAAPAPQPTYGAYQVYKPPSKLIKTSTSPKPTHLLGSFVSPPASPPTLPPYPEKKKPSHTKYGEWELYQPKPNPSYLPSVSAKKISHSKASRKIAYNLAAKQEKLSQKKIYQIPRSKLIIKKQTFKPAVPTAKSNISPQKIPVKLATSSSPDKDLPSSKTSTPPPIKSTPKITELKSSEATPTSPLPQKLAETKKPTPPSTPDPTPSDLTPTPTTPKSLSPVPQAHPQTFFHPGQAKAVHRDWPPIYYNTIHRGSSKSNIRRI